MIHKFSRLLMTLVALFAMTAGAWADEPNVYNSGTVDLRTLKMGDILMSGVTLVNAIESWDELRLEQNRYASDGITQTSFPQDVDAPTIGENGQIVYQGTTYTPVTEGGEAGGAWVVLSIVDASYSGHNYKKVSVGGIEAPLTVTWDATTKTGTFTMPASDVVLTPIYAAATVYGSDGQTEKSAYETLKEAILAAQNGDVIKLEGDVTLANGNELSTAHRATNDPVQFTLDFNGYTLDGLAVGGMCLTAAHEGDQITFTDSSEGQTGGLKGTVQGAPNSLVFDGGRYNFKGMTAAQIKDMWSSTLVPNGFALANGKEFIDIENAPDADGFLVRVAYKDFELAIGPQKFVTFYLDQNVKLDEATSGVTVHTVSGIDTDRSLAYVSPVSGVVAKETPILLYNATDNELTAKLTVTPDDATAVDVAPEFKGTAVDREFTEADMQAADYYALSGGKAFAPVYNPGTIGANKCWLEFAKQQTPGARSINLVFEGGQTTGISVVSGSPADANAIYDLNGRRVTAPAKGVYIQNGKKVVK